MHHLVLLVTLDLLENKSIGTNAGYSNQGAASIGIGGFATELLQESDSIAIRLFTVQYTQGNYSIAIGSIAIGYEAGKGTQGSA